MIEFEKYFKKIYQFKSSEKYSLPKTAFIAPKWCIEELQNKKHELNNVKSLLGKYKLKEWSKHTAHRDPSGFVMKTLSEFIQPELLTQAWCKFYEILCQFPVIPEQVILNENLPLKSLHLCEAPGAFVCAFNHYLVLNHPNQQWLWMANTLNPNYEGNELSQMIPDDRFIRYTLKNWNFGQDFTGDITQFYNHTELISCTFAKNKVWIVTADGSVDCMKDPGEQERHVEFLHFCETMTALSVLQKGGTFVLKIFTMFEDTTINLLYMLNCLFEKVSIFKPCTSKSGNSEVYTIGTNFKGSENLANIWPQLSTVYHKKDHFLSSSMFSLLDIPNEFLEEVFGCADFFMKKQVRTILDNIHFFENKVKSQAHNVYVTKTTVAQLYINMYNPQWIPDEKKIVPNASVGDNWRVHPVHHLSGISRVPTEALDNKQCAIELIDIKFGKQVEVVQNSKFTHKDNLQKIMSVFGNAKKSSKLYEKISRLLSRSNVVINVKDFQLDVYHKYQRDFFYKVYNSLNDKSNIIFVNVFFHTHFLVALLFLLFDAYKTVYIGNGVIVLCNPEYHLVNKIKELFSLIDLKYKEIDDLNSRTSVDYYSDIVQIIQPSVFDEAYSSLVGLIWNYNNKMFSKNACVVKPFVEFQLNT